MTGLRNIICLIIALAIVLSASGCRKPAQNEEPNNNVEPPKKEEPNTESSTATKPSQAKTKRQLVEEGLVIKEGYKAPKYNGKLIAGEMPDKATFRTDWAVAVNTSVSTTDTSALIKKQSLSKTLSDAKAKYENEDVWFRVLIEINDPCGYDADTDSWFRKENDEYKFIKQKALEFLRAIGAHDIKTEVNSSEGNNAQILEASLTSEMIDMLSIGSFKLYLGQYPRNPKHNKVITDTVSVRLDKMSDTDTLVITAVTVHDRYNSFAKEQGLTVNLEYNADRFKLFNGGIGVLLRDGFALLETHLQEIMRRNNILEKQLTTDIKIGRWATGTQKGTIIGTEEYYNDVTAGFNATLTKAEILKLAEDNEIKAIYTNGKRTFDEYIE